MIFGYQIDFIHEPALNFVSDYIDEAKTIKVQEHSLPQFAFLSESIPLSGQQVRYGSHTPFSQSKGKNCEWMLEVEGVLSLVWFSQTQTIGYKKSKYYTAKRLRFWVYHTFLPLLFEMNRVYVILHVGAVEVEGKPILFSALAFGGKSTLTDYFIKQGHTMLGDDTVAIDKRGDDYYAIASYPFHRPFREPEVLGYPVENFATNPKPLHAVYLLEKSKPDAEVEIKELKGIEKFKAFHFSSFVDFSFMKQERFDFFTQMATHIPVYSITVPWDLDRLEDVYRAIVVNTRE
jgi:hypothetical protein